MAERADAFIDAVVGATTMIFSIIMVLTNGLTQGVGNLSLLHAPFLLGLVADDYASRRQAAPSGQAARQRSSAKLFHDIVAMDLQSNFTYSNFGSGLLIHQAGNH